VPSVPEIGTQTEMPAPALSHSKPSGHDPMPSHTCVQKLSSPIVAQSREVQSTSISQGSPSVPERWQEPQPGADPTWQA
jgi:hypothetical protein